jgi:GNAT superfamily N-acetyltransferase
MCATTTRLAGPEDAAAVAALLHALDAHYLGEDRAPPIEAALAMVQRTLAAKEGTRFALAFAGGRPVGIACFALVRPGHRLGGLIYLKDLFVEASARGHGVGAGLMRWLAAYARVQGVARIDLTTERDNPGSQALYERLGGRRMDTKIFYRFDLVDGALSGEDDVE